MLIVKETQGTLQISYFVGPERQRMIIPRRTFLRGALLVTAASAAGVYPSIVKAQEEASTVWSDEAKRMLLATRIRLKEQSFGERQLSFEDAKAHLEQSARLFQLSVPRPFSEQSLTERTYLLRGKEDSRGMENVKRPSGDEFISQLEKDYPGTALTEMQKNLIHEELNIADAWVVDGAAFILLHAANGGKYQVEIREEAGQLPPEEETFPNDRKNTTSSVKLQYLESESKVLCEDAKPIVALRSWAFHEWMHLLPGHQEKILTGPVLELYLLDQQEDLHTTMRGYELSEAVVRNFVPTLTFVHPLTQKIIKIASFRFNELVTDFCGATVSVMNELPYQYSYEKPMDRANFAAVLGQAGISL